MDGMACELRRLPAHGLALRRTSLTNAKPLRCLDAGTDKRGSGAVIESGRCEAGDLV